jgi:ADP-heptose:LPS heptosyltransferase
MSDRVFSRPWWRALGFRLFGALARPHKNRWAPLPTRPARILVLLPVLRGDYLVATPLLAALRSARPRAEITVLVTQPSYDLAVVDPCVDRVILYEKLPWWPRSVYQLLRARPTITVLPKGHPAFTESLLLLLSRAPYRVGLSHPHHDALLTHPVPHNWAREHRTEAFARLLQPFGLEPSEVGRRMHVGRDPNAERRAEQVIEDSGAFHVAVNLSAGTPSRIWPPERWRELIGRLAGEWPEARFHLLGAPAEQSEAARIAGEVEAAEVHRTNTVLEAAALIARCRMLITSDTGIVHISAAREVPQVILYNGDHQVYTRFHPQSIPIRALLAPKGRPVRDIDTGEVLQAALGLRRELESAP